MFFYVRRDNPSRCPNCRQRVTADAAGCSLCGAALDLERRQPPPGPLERAAARWRKLRDARRR
jgi:predicted amidophosphoribosyltransferase